MDAQIGEAGASAGGTATDADPLDPATLGAAIRGRIALTRLQADFEVRETVGVAVAATVAALYASTLDERKDRDASLARTRVERQLAVVWRRPARFTSQGQHETAKKHETAQSSPKRHGPILRQISRRASPGSLVAHIESFHAQLVDQQGLRRRAPRLRRLDVTAREVFAQWVRESPRLARSRLGWHPVGWATGSERRRSKIPSASDQVHK